MRPRGLGVETRRLGAWVNPASISTLFVGLEACGHQRTRTAGLFLVSDNGAHLSVWSGGMTDSPPPPSGAFNSRDVLVSFFSYGKKLFCFSFLLFFLYSIIGLKKDCK